MRPRSLFDIANWRATMRRCAALSRRARPLELFFGDDPVAAVLLGKIERAIAAIDQVRDRLAELELADADRDRDAAEHLPGRAAAALGLRGGPKTRPGQNDNNPLAAIAARQVDLPDALAERGCDEPQHLVTDGMTEI